MTELQLRKKTLLLESDLNRLRLRAELAQLREATDVGAHLKALPQRLGPWAMALAPLAGIAAAIGLRRSSPRAGFLQSALALAPELMRLWRTFSSSSEKPPTDLGEKD
jgi:hypothetical protein